MIYVATKGLYIVIGSLQKRCIVIPLPACFFHSASSRACELVLKIRAYTTKSRVQQSSAFFYGGAQDKNGTYAGESTCARPVHHLAQAPARVRRCPCLYYNVRSERSMSYHNALSVLCNTSEDMSYGWIMQGSMNQAGNRSVSPLAVRRWEVTCFCLLPFAPAQAQAFPRTQRL